ncbi:Aminopeptidase [invertebrate metagenome]|uniref:Aminopeptidase n=1 Tax=invertebrate metagenome TaxID=1711999 RepID=A0A2H9TAV0_9ZZZZ
MDKLSLYGQRLAALRQELEKEQLDAWIIPSSDEFHSEYLPPQSRHMTWLCGFTGENGVVVVTRDKAVTFVDGRFTVQIRQQAPESLFDYEHIHEVSPEKWLANHLPVGSQVGYDGFLHSARWVRETRDCLHHSQLTLLEVGDNLVNRIWKDRPKAGNDSMILLETAGQTSRGKRLEIAQILKEKQCEALLITHPECTNWLLNIRGRDIPCTPLVLSYGLLKNDGSMILLVDNNKLPDSFAAHVGEGVDVSEFSRLSDVLESLSGKTLLLNPDETPDRLYQQVKAAGIIIRDGKDPCLLAKARKNEEEREGFRRAHIRDGIAMCRFLAWLDREVTAGHTHDESTLADKVESLRSEQDLYLEPSFETISALGPNAAICHYNYRYSQPRSLEGESVYLLDSGGQYLDGTTDITRTVAVGRVSDDFKTLSTLVLKGHIALASTRFPACGTTGLQLDMQARLPLWMHGYDYDHGTGHGVGHCLGVHEFPGRFSNRFNSDPLEAGMVMTIEPGYYRNSEWGVRHENMYEVVPFSVDGEIDTLGFRHMTFAPFDNRLLDRYLLTEHELDWLNGYHHQVYEKLAFYLDEPDRQWLKDACQPL